MASSRQSISYDSLKAYFSEVCLVVTKMDEPDVWFAL